MKTSSSSHVRKKPTVSVVTIAFNQEKYIRDALESFMMQKTDFSFEVIVGDDASTDNTPEIIKEYAKSTPEIFKAILRKKNIGVVPNFINALRAAKGKYIAICEGDDYWTDPYKMQRQVDFLEANPDCALCFHPVKVFFENNDRPSSIYPAKEQRADLTVKALLEGNYIQTNSVMYRKQKYTDLPVGILPFDWYLHLYHAQFGKIGFIDKTMAAYRKHPEGLWWEANNDIEKIWEKYGITHLGLYVELQKLYGKNPEYNQILHGHISRMFMRLIEFDQKHKSSLVFEGVRAYPELVEEFFVNQYNSSRQKEEATEREISQLKRLSQEKDNEIQAMKASKFWKIRNIVAKLLHRV